MNRKIGIFWLIPVILLSGIFGYYTNSYKFFDFKNEIDLVSLITLIVTSAIGIYIASSLQKNIDADKFEKALIFDNIKPITNKIKKISDGIANNTLVFQSTKKWFKDISSQLSELENINNACDIIDCNELDKLRTQYLELKTIITDSKIQGELIQLTSENNTLAKKKLTEFKNNLVSLTIKVNRE